MVKNGHQSRDTSPKFKLESTQIANTPYYKSLEQLAKSAKEWMTWKRKLSHEKGYRALRTLTERNQLLAASLRKSFTTGTRRFRQDASDSPTTSTKCKLESLLLSNPNSVEVFSKMANRKSGKQLFKCFGHKIIRITPSTYITAAGKVIKKRDISLRLKNPQVSGHQGPSKPLLGEKMRRLRKFSSSSSSDEPLVPRAKAQQKQLTATTRMDTPTDPKKWKFRAIAPNVVRSSIPIQTPRPAIPVVVLTKSSSSSGGVINPPVAMTSPVAQPSCSKTIPISIRVDKRPLMTRRVTMQPGAEVVSDATGLQPVSFEDDHVTESNVTPQSCPLSIIKQTPENSPTKTPTSPQKIPTKGTEDQDGNESSSSRLSGRSKRQTQFYGSPIRHAVKKVSQASTPGFSSGLTVPVSPAEQSSSQSPRRKNESIQKNKVQPQK